MRIGVDLGGTKIEVVALGEGGRELWRQRAATPAGDYPGTLARITELVGAAEAALERRGTVGIGIPGTISPATGLIKNANSVCLIGHPLDKDLEKALERPIRLANDADCFTLSEATDGAAAGAMSVFGVILGTGAGGGLVWRGQLIQGVNAVAGEWGHNPLPWPRQWEYAAGRLEDERPGPLCYCGRRGCIETFLSGPALARDHQLATGLALVPNSIVAAAATQPEAAGTMERYYDRLARALANVINIFDPAVIVLGGGLSKIEALYSEIPKRWNDWVFSDQVVTRLVPPKYGDASGVRGAAWLWPDAGPGSPPGFSSAA
ncbi:MAG: ROK family protein [Alphaproteobacteria bacterium]|nr:ROK family protein [Alphaproteobacteria bacterium]